MLVCVRGSYVSWQLCGCAVKCGGLCFFFQAEDGIRDLVRSRGLGDVYKRQVMESTGIYWKSVHAHLENAGIAAWVVNAHMIKHLSLIHI